MKTRRERLESIKAKYIERKGILTQQYIDNWQSKNDLFIFLMEKIIKIDSIIYGIRDLLKYIFKEYIKNIEIIINSLVLIEKKITDDADKQLIEQAKNIQKQIIEIEGNIDDADEIEIVKKMEMLFDKKQQILNICSKLKKYQQIEIMTKHERTKQLKEQAKKMFINQIKETGDFDIKEVSETIGLSYSTTRRALFELKKEQSF